MPDANVGEVEVALDAVALGRLGGKIESRLPSLRPDFDLLVFLWEIGEVAELVNLFKTQVGTLMDKITGKDLEMHFAVLPLLGEAQSIIDIVESIFHRYNQVLAGAGKVHDLKASVTVPETKSLIPQEPWSSLTECTHAYPYGMPCSTLCTTQRIRDYYSAVVKYRYAMPEHATDFGAKLAKILTAIGFAPNFESYWQVIPFSFVVDWVFNTDRLFKQLHLDANNLDVSTEIIDCCVTRRVVVTENREYNRPCFSCVADGTTGAEKVCTTLDRGVGEEAYEMLNGPWFKMPGFMQLHLGASLLWQLHK